MPQKVSIVIRFLFSYFKERMTTWCGRGEVRGRESQADSRLSLELTAGSVVWHGLRTLRS